MTFPESHLTSNSDVFLKRLKTMGTRVKIIKKSNYVTNVTE